MPKRLDPAGIRSITNAIERIAKERGAEAARTAGFVLEGELKAELSRAGTGRIYKRGGVTHQASRPGEPPAPDTGRLRASVTNEQLPDGSVQVKVTAPYAVALEFGTSRMAPRPYVRAAIARMKQRVKGVFARVSRGRRSR